MEKIYLALLKGVNQDTDNYWATLLGVYPTKHEAIVRCREVYKERLEVYKERAEEERGEFISGEYLDYFEAGCYVNADYYEQETIYVKEVEIGKDYYSLLTD